MELTPKTDQSAHQRALLLSERRLLLASFDFIVAGVAFVVAFNLRTSLVRHTGFAVPRAGMLLAAAVWVLSAALAGAYDLRGSLTLRKALRSVGITATIAAATLLFVFFISPFQITRPTILLSVPFAGAGMFTVRALYRRWVGSARLVGTVALIAPRSAIESAWPEINEYMDGVYHIAAYIDPHQDDAIDRLKQAVDTNNIDQIIVGVRDNVSRPLFLALLQCHEKGVPIRSLADVYEDLTGKLLLDQLGHTWLMALPMRSETSRLYALFKRATDVACGLLGMAALVVITPIVAIGITIENRGSLLYRQVRVGKYGRHFTIVKFRTMRHSGKPDWTADHDVRVMKFGRLLRRTHLDELPQAFTILRGDMSVVGPRPEQPQYVHELAQQIDFYTTRLTVRPGLTGWAQVNYGYGSGVDGARVKLAYDLYYIKRQSVSLDVAIIAKTMRTALSFGGR